MLPVHLLCYQRPELLKEQLRKIKTNKVYFSVDKPRVVNYDTEKNYNSILEIITSYNSSNKEIILFDTNLGYLTHFIQSTKKIFENEEKIIHLEDDIIPSNTFYTFCNKLIDNVEPIFGFSSNFFSSYDGTYFKTLIPQFYWGACYSKKWGLGLVDFFESCLEVNFLVEQIIYLDKINSMFNGAFDVHLDNLKMNLKILKNIGNKAFFNWVTDSIGFCYTLKNNFKSIRPSVSLVSPSINDKYCLTKNLLFDKYATNYIEVNDVTVFNEIPSPYNLDEQDYSSILAQ